MSVMPGFGGQEFELEALEKLRHLRAVAGSRLLLSVDGGVNLDTVASCAAAGADLFVTGSALFSQPHYGRFIDEMTGLARCNRSRDNGHPERSEGSRAEMRSDRDPSLRSG
jgi:pentose-5-phosphate-3-epimerase